MSMKYKKYSGGMTQSKDYVRIAVLIFSVIILGVILNTYSKDESSSTSNIYIYAFSLILPLIIAFYFAMQTYLKIDRFVIGIIMVFIIISSLIYFFYNFLNSASQLLLKCIINVLGLLIILLALAILYKMFANNLIKAGGNSKLIILLIFYLPCMLSDMIQFIKDQLHVTPNITYILLILELLTVLAYLFLPRYFGSPSINGGIELQKGKIFLDTLKILTLADVTMINTLDDDINVNDTSRREYSLSMWIYLNTPEMNDIAFPIICYGDSDIRGKPLITYGYDKKLNSFVLTITFSDSNNLDPPIPNPSVKINIPNQKWNNLVFNYKGSNSDLFLNGILEKSINLSNNMPIFSVSDIIKVGSNTNGINGVISDIVYYMQPLSALEILGSYRLGINTINL